MFSFKLLLIVQDYDPAEVLKAIVDYIPNFFGCRECGQNFLKETANYKDAVIKPYDEILYLWTVHNRVNKRLSGDDTEDPKHKKIQFPAKIKCPECYKNPAIIGENESPFESEETLKYLLKFYSIDNINGAVREMMIQEKLDPVINKPHHVQIVKNITTEAVVGERDSLDDHGVHGNIHVDAIVRIPDPVDEHRQHLPVHGDRNRVDYEVVRDSMMMDNSINLDFALSLTIYGLVLLAFVCLYMYFKMLKRKSSLRMKKRYIL